MQKDLISIIIPVYNGEEYIARLIELILQNPYKNIEILIADDGSTDSTLKVLRAYEENLSIRIFKSEKNIGPGATRNKLLEMAQGEFIALQDADDLFQLERFLLQYNFLKENPKIGAVGSNAALISQKSGKLWGHIQRKENPGVKEWLTQSSMVHASLMLRRESIKDTRYKEDIILGEDYYFMTELYFNRVKFRNLPASLYMYYVEENDLKTRVCRKFWQLNQAILVISEVVPMKFKFLFIFINFTKLSVGYLRGMLR